MITVAEDPRGKLPKEFSICASFYRFVKDTRQEMFQVISAIPFWLIELRITIHCFIFQVDGEHGPLETAEEQNTTSFLKVLVATN